MFLILHTAATALALQASTAVHAHAHAHAHAQAHSGFMHFMRHMGLVGLLPISAVDSSFVPLPIPGITDILLIAFAAAKANIYLLVLLSTIGSALGGLFSHAVGQAGGLAFLEKHVPKAILSRVTHWMEHHAILSVALPALLPPPMPLSPFVLVAGAVHMSRKKFMWAFTISRFIRHSLAVWIGVHYGKAFLHLWSRFSSRWATTIMIVLWSVILIFMAVACWKLYKVSRTMNLRPNPKPRQHSTS
jgi:membrane protein YqaA with SNARE-associated domain